MLAAEERVLPKNDPWTLRCREDLLAHLRSQFKSAEAEPVARAVVLAREHALGTTHSATLLSRQILAELLLAQGKELEAEKEYGALVDPVSRALGVDSNPALECRVAFARLLLKHARPEEARRHLLIALTVQDSQGIGDAPGTSLSLAYGLQLTRMPLEALEMGQRAALGLNDTIQGTGTTRASAADAVTEAKSFLARMFAIAKGSPDFAGEPDKKKQEAQDALLVKEGPKGVIERAMAGDASMQDFLCDLFQEGAGVEKDAATAFRWELLSAEGGNRTARSRVALSYSNGTGVKQDPEKAFHWWSLLAPAGDTGAMIELGLCYQYGKGVARDPNRMLQCFGAAAVAGDARVFSKLAFLYIAGGEYGVEPNQETACKWFAQGAVLDDPVCLHNLAILYMRGEGVPMNHTHALVLWRSAAEQGYAPSQSKMGAGYAGGRYIAKDYGEAYFWLKLAANQGDKSARDLISLTYSNLSKKQLEQAEERIKKFKPREPRPDPSFSKNKRRAKGEGVVTGTGFFISSEGYFVTNYHVIKAAAEIHVRMGSDDDIPATLVAQDKNADLAILKVSTARPHTVLPVTSVRGVKLGATVATVGFPNPSLQGFSPKLAKGDIASLAGAGDNPGQFQISVPVQPGNSGGSLVDSKGNVVGVVCAVINQQLAYATSGQLATNVAYAVKSSLLMNLIESVPGLQTNCQPSSPPPKPVRSKTLWMPWNTPACSCW
ncbi:MAG: hypothetical protein JWO94_112 [Verrucomicrobiaceae bacterium]|nr:hypothetical protein [Verrucomicrobiaceae bacterium]